MQRTNFPGGLENLRLYNGKSLILPPTDLCISTNPSTKGWGEHMPGDINKWAVVTGGTKGSHQHTRAEGSLFNHIDFYKI